LSRMRLSLRRADAAALLTSMATSCAQALSRATRAPDPIDVARAAALGALRRIRHHASRRRHLRLERTMTTPTASGCEMQRRSFASFMAGSSRSCSILLMGTTSSGRDADLEKRNRCSVHSYDPQHSPHCVHSCPNASAAAASALCLLRCTRVALLRGAPKEHTHKATTAVGRDWKRRCRSVHDE
jgi:hypothetical protein